MGIPNSRDCQPPQSRCRRAAHTCEDLRTGRTARAQNTYAAYRPGLHAATNL